MSKWPKDSSEPSEDDSANDGHYVAKVDTRVVKRNLGLVKDLHEVPFFGRINSGVQIKW